MQAFLEIRYEEHIRGKNHINHYIFTDSDMAVVDDLGDTFLKYPDFHLALTFRNNKAQPLNSGFIAVRGTPDGLQKYVVCIHYLECGSSFSFTDKKEFFFFFLFMVANVRLHLGSV